MTQQFTASEVRKLIERLTDHNHLPAVARACLALRAFADMLEAREKAVPVMVVNHVSSAEHDLPIGMKLYAHPSADENTKRLQFIEEHPGWLRYSQPHGKHKNGWCCANPLTNYEYEMFATATEAIDAARAKEPQSRELAKRIERGEKGKLVDKSTPCQSQDAERLAEVLERTARHRAAADGIDPDQWRSVLYGWEDRALAAHSTQAQPPAASVTDAMVERAVKAWTSSGFGNPGQVFSIYSVAKVMLEAALAAQENPNG